MKPIYSEEERRKIVKHFISLRGQGKVPISDFDPITTYLDNGSIKILAKISQHGRAPRIDYDGRHRVGFFYNNHDAEEYFNWLISILTGAEEASDETRKLANDQLFMFIFALRDDMSVSLDDLLDVSSDWEHLNRNFMDFQKKTDARHEEMMDVLEKIGNWQKHYQPYLDTLKREQNIVKKGLKGTKAIRGK